MAGQIKVSVEVHRVSFSVQETNKHSTLKKKVYEDIKDLLLTELWPSASLEVIQRRTLSSTVAAKEQRVRKNLFFQPC